jgi:hypothetical protein
VPSATTQIRRSASDVFAFVCDWRNFESLLEESSIEVLTPQPPVNARLGQVMEYAQTRGNTVMHTVSTVTRFEECSLVEWDIGFPKVVDAGREETPPLPSILVTCELSGHEATTQLKVSFKVHGRSPAILKFFFVVWLVFQRYQIVRGLRTIKTRLESCA